MKSLIIALILLFPSLLQAQLVKIVSKQTDYVTDKVSFSTISPDNKYLYTSSFTGGLGVFSINETGYSEQQIIAAKKIDTPYMNGVTQYPIFMGISHDGKYMYVANRTLSLNYDKFGDGIDVYSRDSSTGKLTQTQKYLAWQDDYQGLEKIQKFLLTEQDNLLITINIIGGISTSIIDTNSGELTQLNKYDINTLGFEDFQGPTDIIEVGEKRLLVLNPSSNYIHLLEYSDTGDISIVSKVSTKVAASIESPTKIIETQSPDRYLFLGETEVGSIEVISGSSINVSRTTWEEQAPNLIPEAGLAYNEIQNNYLALSIDTGDLITFVNDGETNTIIDQASITMETRHALDGASIISSNLEGSILSITGYSQGLVALINTQETSDNNLFLVGHDKNEISKISGVSVIESLNDHKLLTYSSERAFTQFHFDSEQKLLVQEYFTLIENTAQTGQYTHLRGVKVSHDKNHLYATFAGNKGDAGVNTYALEPESKQINKIDYVNGDSLNINNFTYGHVLGDNATISISPNDDFIYFSNGKYDPERYNSDETLEIFSRSSANGLLTFEGRFIDDNQLCGLRLSQIDPSQDTILHTKDNEFIYIAGNNTISILKKDENGQLSCLQNSTREGMPAAPFSMALLKNDNYLVIAETNGIRLFSRNTETGLLSELDTWSLSDIKSTIIGKLDNVRKIIVHPAGNRFFALANDTSKSPSENYLGYFKVNYQTNEIELLDTINDFYDEAEEVKSITVRDWAFSYNGEYLHLITKGLNQHNIWNIEILEKAPINIALSNLQATVDEVNKIIITWSEINDSVYYKVYSSDTRYGEYNLLTETQDFQYSHTNLSSGEEKFYKIQSCNDMGCTGLSDTVRGVTSKKASQDGSNEGQDSSSSGGGSISFLLLLIIIANLLTRLFVLKRE